MHENPRQYYIWEPIRYLEDAQSTFNVLSQRTNEASLGAETTLLTHRGIYFEGISTSISLHARVLYL